MYRNLFWKIFPALLILISLLVGAFLYLQKTGSQVKQTPISVSPTPTPSPTSQPVKLDLTKYNVEILNGSGIPGDAAKAKTVLEKEGFTTVNTGNALQLENNTIVAYSNALPENEIGSLTDLLKGNFPSATFLEATPSASYNIIITIGKNSQ